MSIADGKDSQSPIEVDFISAAGGPSLATLRTFTSYNFDRSLLVPASAFRFTAPGVDKTLRTSIRSCDTVSLYGVDSGGTRIPIATGFVDETDTHVMPNAVEYLITGRDTLGQLVDNAAVDAQNKIQNTDKVSIDFILGKMLANTRMPQQYQLQQVPNGKLLWQTNPGETKINCLQRYLDLMNCLVWTMPNGQVKIGKPDYTAPASGFLRISSSDPSRNNCLEARARRNVNQAIRQIIVQLQTLEQVDAAAFTRQNTDPDMKRVAGALGGRSVWMPFSYGTGSDAVNQFTQVGNQSASPTNLGASYAAREMAKDNMKLLDVEAVVRGHVNSAGAIFDVDQVYDVFIEDDDVEEPMLVYNVGYELTETQGLLTRLHLCRLGTIVDGAFVRSQTIPIGQGVA